MAKYIGETNEDYTNGEDYALIRFPMIGIIFKPGKDLQGKWLDTVGEKDNRIMVWKNMFAPKERTGYKVYTPEEIANNWEGGF